MKTKSMAILALCLLAASTLSFGADEARVLRVPAISKDQIVFSSGGDLYSVPLAGGLARKLTSYHDGYEAFARFSPDGKSIAFTGEYDGNREVYLMPAEGGVPRRLTYTPSLGRDDISDRMGPNNLVMGWTPDGKNVVFRSRMRDWNDFNGQLYLVPAAGGPPDQLPLPRGGFCSYSPDGRKLAYNRIFREFRTWKRYRGGMADDIWIYDFATKKIENITDNPALDIFPMWSGDRVYFVSDRDEKKKVNLYVRDLKTKETRKLTDFAEYDIKFPSIGPASIIFENGGYLYTFDLASEKTAKVPVTIADDAAGARSRLAKVSGQITNFGLSPDGKRALFGAHGEVFTVPAEHGNVRNLTATPGVHERATAWSPDGKWIAYISDKTGEDEICIAAQDGTGEPRQLTRNADTYKYQPFWSPAGTKIRWDDRLQRLSYVDIETKEVVQVVKAERWELQRFAWSPDSRWIAYAKPEVEGMMKVYLYSLDTKKTVEVTDGWYRSSEPCFSPDGKYLFFVSDRDFNPVFSATEFDHAYLSLSRVYFVTLAADTKSPFEPKSDEVAVKKEEAKPAAVAPAAKPAAKPADGKDAGSAAPVVVKVDADGLKGRTIALPIATANYGRLAAVGSAVYYLRVKDMEKAPSLVSYDLAELKEKELGKVNGYDISADGKKMLVAKDGAYGIIDLPKGPIALESKLDLSG
ncbi:MAG: protease, partial [Acidobacteriota bacterium]